MRENEEETAGVERVAPLFSSNRHSLALLPICTPLTIMHARKAASSSAQASWPPPGPFLGFTFRGRSAGVRPMVLF